MDLAKRDTETSAKQLQDEFDALDKLLVQDPVDKDAIALQIQDVDAEIENYFNRQDTYREMLVAAKKNAEYDKEEADRKAVRKRKSRTLAAIAKVCGLATSPGSSSSSSGTPLPDTSGYRVHLPKREMPKFDGNVRQWRSFWASFQEVDGDTTIPKIEKYNFLLQSMTANSPARKVVESFPPADTSYDLAKAELEHRFGRKKTLIKVYVRDLLSLVVENAKEKKNSNFVDVVTKLQSQILNLEQLGVTQDKYGELLYPIIESCIPADVLNRYLDLPGVKEELEEILDFLRNEVRRREESDRAQSAFASTEKEDKRQRGNKEQDQQFVPTATTFFNANGKPQCAFCGCPHNSADCRKASFMSADERRSLAKTANACFRCLITGHNSYKCKAKNTCRKCGKTHHTLLCVESGPQQQLQQVRMDQLHVQPYPPNRSTGEREYREPPQRPPHEYSSLQAPLPQPLNWAYGPGPSSFQPQSVTPSVDRRSASTARAQENERVDMTNYLKKADVLVQTQCVFVYAVNGKRKVIRVMHDTGSQSSYIRLALAMEMGVEPVGFEKIIHQTFGAKLSKEMQHAVVSFEISGLEAPYDQRLKIQASVMEDLGKNVIAAPYGPWLRECAERKIPLTDVVGSAHDIDLIIGNDISPYLKVGLRSTLLPCGLVATECRLGWFLEAQIPGSARNSCNKAMVCLNMQITDKDVSNYWALETIGIRDEDYDKSKAELKEAAMEHFGQTVKQEQDGRYMVHLPWIEGHPALPDNKQLCFRRLEKTTKDLARDGYLQQYHGIFQEWEQKGIIERVSSTPTNTIVHYLGHRPVFKEGSTTPVRPVFNASGRLKQNPSLNDCLEKGPNLLEIIPTIISRFRLGKIGVSADIAKAFLQLLVTKEHRDCLRFLWWEDPNDRRTIVEYRHCRVVFGVSSSPFLLGAVINHLLDKNEAEFPKTVEILRSSFYVDNCVASLDTLKETLHFKQEAKRIFQSACMDLRCWEYGPTSDGKIVPVLGLLWNTGTDVLSFEMNKIMKKLEFSATKRSVLMLANSLYDPLGMLSPVIIVIKIIFKKICMDEQKFSWDTELPDAIAKEVDSWKTQLGSMEKVEIPRLLTVPGVDSSRWSIHVMADASKDAYACCVYLRIESSPVRVQLIQARARVTPAKVVTIPRAELLGCLIAARLYKQVKEDLRIPHVPVTFWSDSTTAVTWIQKTHRVWATFVNRRVEEIRRLTNPNDWRHIPGEVNPADYPSRGISLRKYLDLRWWEGPEWLRGPVSGFPNSQPVVDIEEVEQEKRKCVISNMALLPASNSLDDLIRLGDWNRIVRALAYIVIFVRNRFLGEQLTTIGAEEFKRAETVLFRHIQKSVAVPTGLRTWMDERGILRVVTKLVAGEDTTNFSFPIVLPGSHVFVRLLVEKVHSLASHGGVQYVMTSLRQHYWIINARRTVKAVINKCAICRVHMAKRCKVVEAPLPMDRTTTTYCFEVVGVDLAGPLVLRNGEKVWIVLYTCAVYRAVHLELLSSLSTEAFLQSLRKFVARRGRPSKIYSDNGTNFRGCSNLFQTVDWEKVKQFAAVKRISWIFNPPTGAWWGGFWERLIGMMKQLLRRVLGSRSVYYQELEVLLVEVESVLNERPLTYISEDPTDLRPLTPSLFLRDLPVACLPEADITAKSLRRNLKHVQKLREELRSRFRKEYLSQLISSNRVKKSIELQPGDVVLVEVDNKKRIEWPMGVITAVYPGRDGKCRTAKIRTTQGELVRPYQRLFPLELHGDNLPNGVRGKIEKPMDKLDYEEPDDDDIQEEMLTTEDAEPVIITKFGRTVRKPERLGF